MTHPHDLVEDVHYFKQVFGNMVKVIPEKECRRVRFGTEGKGHSPNYEVSYPEGHPREHEKFQFAGLSHKPHHHAPNAFAREHLTEQYTVEYVQSQMLRCDPKLSRS